MPPLPLVLLVEDDQINAFVAMKFLQQHCRINHVTSGPEAIKLLESNPFDLVLMDINLGDEQFDGVAVLNRIRAHQSWKHLPVIAVTAYAMTGDRKKFLEAGFDSYLAKPVKREQLIEEINRFLRN